MDSPAFLCNASRRAWKCVIAYLLASALVGKPAGRCGTYGDDLLGDRLHCVVIGVKEIPAILEKAELFSATHSFHFVQLLLDRMQPCLNLSLVHLASGEAIKASIKCVVNVLIGFLLVTHSVSVENQPLCAQVEAC